MVKWKWRIIRNAAIFIQSLMDINIKIIEGLDPPIWWHNTWMNLTREKVNSILLWPAGWPDQSGENWASYSPVRTETEASNKRYYNFVLVNRVTMIIYIMKRGWYSIGAATILCFVIMSLFKPYTPHPPQKCVIIVIILVQPP